MVQSCRPHGIEGGNNAQARMRQAHLQVRALPTHAFFPPPRPQKPRKNHLATARSTHLYHVATGRRSLATFRIAAHVHHWAKTLLPPRWLSLLVVNVSERLQLLLCRKRHALDGLVMHRCGALLSRPRDGRHSVSSHPGVSFNVN